MSKLTSLSLGSGKCAMASAADPEFLCDSHEERLQRLEDSRMQLGAAVAGQIAALGALQESIRIDMDRVVCAVQRVEEKLDHASQRITVLEQKDAGSEHWREFGRKVLFWATTTGFAGIGAFLVSHFLKH